MSFVNLRIDSRRLFQLLVCMGLVSPLLSTCWLEECPECQKMEDDSLELGSYRIVAYHSKLE